MSRLGSTAARLKLKGIDGDPHKRWSMWFNSTVSEEPYQGLTLPCKRTETCDLRGWATGAARLSSARVVNNLATLRSNAHEKPNYIGGTPDSENQKNRKSENRIASPTYPIHPINPDLVNTEGSPLLKFLEKEKASPTRSLPM